MDFVLSLKDGLAREATPPTAEHLEYFASGFLIPLEYEALANLECPVCAAKNWELGIQSTLQKRKDLDWPYKSPAGDSHKLRCQSCGEPLTVNFWFTN